MAATYSGDPRTSAKDSLRFVLGDTNVNDAMLQDAEISYLIEEFSGSKLYAEAFSRCADFLGARTVKRKLGPQSEDATDRLNHYRERAAYYKAQAQFGVVPPLPVYQADKVFEKGMMTNAE